MWNNKISLDYKYKEVYNNMFLFSNKIVLFIL